MVKSHIYIFSALLCAVFFTRLIQAEEATAKIEWQKVMGAGVSKLTAVQRSQVEKNLRQLQNTHGCKGSLAGCMAKGDVTARRHAGFIVRAVTKGKNDAFIAEHLALRHASAHPADIAPIDLSDRPMRGTVGAPVTIVAFECFQCPFCAHLSVQTKELHSQFKNKTLEYYKFFPVRSHPRGVAAALAGLAAYRQGKFWPMYDTLFANRANLEDRDLQKYAKNIKLNVDKFNKDIKDPSLMKMVEKDKLEGMRFGVDGTPTFFINGKRYQAQYNIDEIEDRIGEELDIIEGRIPK